MRQNFVKLPNWRELAQYIEASHVDGVTEKIHKYLSTMS